MKSDWPLIGLASLSDTKSLWPTTYFTMEGRCVTSSAQRKALQGFQTPPETSSGVFIQQPLTLHLSFAQSQWQKGPWCGAWESSFPLEGRRWRGNDVVSVLKSEWHARCFPFECALYSPPLNMFSSKYSFCVMIHELILFQGERACQEVLWQAVQRILYCWPQPIQGKQGEERGDEWFQQKQNKLPQEQAKYDRMQLLCDHEIGKSATKLESIWMCFVVGQTYITDLSVCH